MACSSTDTTGASFSNTCFIANPAANSTISSALQTCCGAANVFTADNGCYSFCSTTGSQEQISWYNCLAANLPPDTFTTLDAGCNDGGKANVLATTTMSSGAPSTTSESSIPTSLNGTMVSSMILTATSLFPSPTPANTTSTSRAISGHKTKGYQLVVLMGFLMFGVFV